MYNTISITAAQRQQFKEEGYFILQSVITDCFLGLLRNACQIFVDQTNAEMDRRGVDQIGLSHRNKRYFSAHCYQQQPELRDFLFCDMMAEICRATLGDDAYLFWEQYVVKGASEGMKFGWHQDSGYHDNGDHRPYLTCWCALDDMSEENGTVYIMPFSDVGIRSWVKHVREEGSNDRVGYFGDKKGIPVIVPAGSIAVFSSLNFHCSGENRGGQLRRAYIIHYSAEPVLSGDGTKLKGSAEPFLVDGKYAVGAKGFYSPIDVIG